MVVPGALGRLTTETFSDSTPALSFIYDTSSGCTVPNGATITDSAGRLVCAMNANGTETLYSYDTAGRAVNVWEEAPGSAWAEQSYAYFYNGQISSYTNPVGDTFTYTADSPGRITAIQAPSGWNSGEMVLSSAVYSPFRGGRASCSGSKAGAERPRNPAGRPAPGKRSGAAPSDALAGPGRTGVPGPAGAQAGRAAQPRWGPRQAISPPGPQPHWPPPW